MPRDSPRIPRKSDRWAGISAKGRFGGQPESENSAERAYPLLMNRGTKGGGVGQRREYKGRKKRLYND